MFCFTPHNSSYGGLEETYKSILQDGDHLDIIAVVREVSDVEGMAEGGLRYYAEDEVDKFETSSARKLRKAIADIQLKYPRKITSSYKFEGTDKPGPVFCDVATILVRILSIFQ
jgi:hypothetical protein